MKKAIVIGLLLVLTCCGFSSAQALKQIGVVSAPEQNKTTGKMEPSFQQQVWMNVLNSPQRFTLKVIDDEALASPDKLSAFSAVVIPATRLCLSAGQMDALKTYVRQGGRLIRDLEGANSLDTDKFSPSSVAAARDFWKEIGGASVDSTYINYARSFRFSPEPKRLLRDLPDKLDEGDIPSENRLARTVYFYKLDGASAVAEAQVMHINSWKWDDEAKPLDGVRPIVCLNKYGKGYCLSSGMIYPRALNYCYGNISCDIYRTFCSNLISWCLE